VPFVGYQKPYGGGNGRKRGKFDPSYRCWEGPAGKEQNLTPGIEVRTISKAACEERDPGRKKKALSWSRALGQNSTGGFKMLRGHPKDLPGPRDKVGSFQPQENVFAY